MAEQSNKRGTGEQTSVSQDPPFVFDEPADFDSACNRQAVVDKDPGAAAPPKDDQASNQGK